MQPYPCPDYINCREFYEAYDVMNFFDAVKCICPNCIDFIGHNDEEEKK